MAATTLTPEQVAELYRTNPEWFKQTSRTGATNRDLNQIAYGNYDGAIPGTNFWSPTGPQQATGIAGGWADYGGEGGGNAGTLPGYSMWGMHAPGEAEDWHAPFEQDADGNYTFDPTRPEIQSRVWKQVLSALAVVAPAVVLAWAPALTAAGTMTAAEAGSLTAAAGGGGGLSAGGAAAGGALGTGIVPGAGAAGYLGTGTAAGAAGMGGAAGSGLSATAAGITGITAPQIAAGAGAVAGAGGFAGAGGSGLLPTGAMGPSINPGMGAGAEHLLGALSQGGGGGSDWMQKLKDLLGGGATGGNNSAMMGSLIDLLRSGINMNQQNELGKMQMARADAATPHMGYYNDRLKEHYIDPQSYFKDPNQVYQRSLEAVHNTLQRKDAAGGNLSNDINRQKTMMDYSQDQWQKYGTGLAQIANQNQQTYTGNNNLATQGATNQQQVKTGYADILENLLKMGQ